MDYKIKRKTLLFDSQVTDDLKKIVNSKNIQYRTNLFNPLQTCKKYPEQSPNSIPDMKSRFSILEFYS